MKYQFVRRQDDGRISSISPLRSFNTIEEAKKAAPDLLYTRRGGGELVLIQVLEVVIATASVRYEKWDDHTKRKVGLISSERI